MAPAKNTQFSYFSNWVQICHEISYCLTITWLLGVFQNIQVLFLHCSLLQKMCYDNNWNFENMWTNSSQLPAYSLFWQDVFPAMLCFSHSSFLSCLLLLPVSLYPISRGSHGISVFLSAKRPLGLQSQNIPHSSPTNSLLNLPSFQICPTHQLPAKSYSHLCFLKRNWQYIMLWSFSCELWFVCAISGTVWAWLENVGILFKYPLCKL